MNRPDDERNPKTGNVRCSARAKATGERCRCWSILGGTVCFRHGGAAPQVRLKARERIKQAADDAANYLVQWLADDAVDKRLRVQIAQDLLDRAGITSKQQVNVEVRKFEQLAESGALLIDLPEPEQIGAGNGDIVDAEVVDDSGRDWVERVDGPLPAPRRRDPVRYKGRQAPR
jgi:hypothetical protein